jgi:hypothetical protein
MPRTVASGSSHDWDRLFELASAQAGYLTNEQALEAGYSLPLLQFHSSTLPRTRENSRVEDRPDPALLAQVGPLGGTSLRTAIEATFPLRKTRPIPLAFPPSRASWAGRYATIARDDELPWPTLDAVEAAARAVLDSVLAGDTGTRSSEVWSWQRPEPES